jgi:hypothetical protein
VEVTKLDMAGRRQRGVTRYHVPHTEIVEALRQTEHDSIAPRICNKMLRRAL